MKNLNLFFLKKINVKQFYKNLKEKGGGKMLFLWGGGGGDGREGVKNLCSNDLPVLKQYIVTLKKRKPGELQYAELAEFSAGQGGPRSSTSPTNRPTEIQYADVNAM